MYNKKHVKVMLRKVNSIINGSLYGELENDSDVDYDELCRVQKNLERML